MKEFSLFVILSCIVLLSGCGDKEVDTSVPSELYPTTIKMLDSNTRIIEAHIIPSDAFAERNLIFTVESYIDLIKLPDSHWPLTRKVQLSDSILENGIFKPIKISATDDITKRILQFYIKDSLNRGWEEITFIYYHIDPRTARKDEIKALLNYKRTGYLETVKYMEIREVINRFSYCKFYLFNLIEDKQTIAHLY